MYDIAVEWIAKMEAKLRFSEVRKRRNQEDDQGHRSLINEDPEVL